MQKLGQKARHIIENHLSIDMVNFEAAIDCELSRDEYVAVDEVLKLVGGKWSSKKKVHEFPYNPDPALALILSTGVLPGKNPTAFFPTPSSAIDDMFAFLDERFSYERKTGPFRFLEPSAGTGFIAERLREWAAPNAIIDTVEILECNQEVLKSKGFNPFCGSFLDYAPEEKYDVIVMNPPFSVKGDKQAYITHIMHAFSMLNSRGQLVAILPEGWKTNQSKTESEFRDFVSTYMGNELGYLPKGTFKESGTNIATDILSLVNNEWRSKPFNGYASHYSWDFFLRLENNSEKMQSRGYQLITADYFDEEKAYQLCKDLIEHESKSYIPSNMHGYRRFIPLPESRFGEFVEELKAKWLYEHKEQVVFNEETGQGELFAA